MKNNERTITTLMFPDIWLALQVLINCYNSEWDTIRHCQATCGALNDRSLEVDGCWNCPDYDPIVDIKFHKKWFGRDKSLNNDILGILKASWGVEGILDPDSYTQHESKSGEYLPGVVKHSDMIGWLDWVNKCMSNHFNENLWGSWFDLPEHIFTEWALHMFDKMWHR